MRLGFVFTNFNNTLFTKQAIESIAKDMNFPNSYIVIVDNSSEAEEVEKLKALEALFPSITVIYSEENVGYFKGLNIGIKYLRKTHVDLDYVIVGNNDLVFPKNFASQISENIDVFNKYAVISPNIITLDGVHQNPHVISEISKIREIIYDIYYSNYYLSVIITRLANATRSFTKRNDESHHEQAGIIYQGYGACYILGPVFFANFELLWAPTFLMGEELFLSKQLEGKNQFVYYEPKILINHHDHATVKKLPTRKLWEISRQSHKIYRQYVKIF